MSFTSPEFIIGVAAALGLGGFIVAILTLKPTRRKLTAEASKSGGDAAAILTSSAISLLEPMKEELESVRASMKTMRVEHETEVTSYKLQVKILNDELKSLRGEMRELLAELAAYRRGTQEN